MSWGSLIDWFIDLFILIAQRDLRGGVCHS